MFKLLEISENYLLFEDDLKVLDIKVLDLRNKGITDLTGLEYFKNLSLLYLSDNSITKSIIPSYFKLLENKVLVRHNSDILKIAEESFIEKVEKVLFREVYDNVSSDGKIAFERSYSQTGVKTNAGINKGKWYAEFYLEIESRSSKENTKVGIATKKASALSGPQNEERGYYKSVLDGMPGSGVVSPADVKTGDIFGIAVDLDKGKIFFSLNGVWKKDPLNEIEGIDVPILVKNII